MKLKYITTLTFLMSEITLLGNGLGGLSYLGNGSGGSHYSSYLSNGSGGSHYSSYLGNGSGGSHYSHNLQIYLNYKPFLGFDKALIEDQSDDYLALSQNDYKRLLGRLSVSKEAMIPGLPGQLATKSSDGIIFRIKDAKQIVSSR